MRDCTQIPEQSGERLGCEVQNEVIKTEKDQSFAAGCLFGMGFLAIFLLIWKLLSWLEKQANKEYGDEQ